ncbi:PaaI family thioesterase [candidate division KSB1 bacterium]|nr:PaaI family thioesterase [candidate division KSB1 bacterium]
MMKKTTAPKNFENLLKARLRNAPISDFLGHRLIVCKDGRAEVRLPYRAEFQQSYGVVHGGIVATVADTAGFFAAASASPAQMVTTVEFKINLLSGAREENLTGVGKVIRNGRQLVVCEMIVYGRRRRKIALASGTYAGLDQSWT